MRKVSRDKKENFFCHYIKSIKYSLEGLFVAFKEERSFHLYLFSVILLILLSIYYSISFLDQVIVAFALTFILVVELLNTALESIVDLVSPEYHKLAKKAKDCGSAATFVVVVFALILGIIIFIPYIS